MARSFSDLKIGETHTNAAGERLEIVAMGPSCAPAGSYGNPFEWLTVKIEGHSEVRAMAFFQWVSWMARTSETPPAGVHPS